MTCKDALLEKDLLRKVSKIQIFEYLPLGSELKKQTDIAEKQYKNSGKASKLDDIIFKKNNS